MPLRCDVAVVGAGFTGRFVHRLLQAQGVDAVLVGSADDELLPLLQVGTTEHPHRLEAALGTERARDYVQFSQRAAQLLRQHVPVTRGGWRVGVRDEVDELEASVAASERLGLASALVQTPLGLARAVPEDGVATLDRQAEVLPGQVTGVLEEDDVILEGVDVVCTAAVLCSGWRLSALEGWFADKLTPVRAQALLLDDRAERGGSGQHGHLYWAPTADGLLVGGARWATPHLESWETEPVPNPRVSERLRAWSRQHWQGAELGERAVIRTYTCDNLPLLGPLPGRCRLIACTGFGENTLALAPAAAEAVVQGLLTGQATLPPFLAASRFV